MLPTPEPEVGATRRSRIERLAPPALLIAAVITVYWKLVLTNQYTFLESPDLANQVLPWLQAQVYAIRHFSVLLWDPYEWNGQSLIGQVQAGVTSPFTYLLALAPVNHGMVQIYWVHWWFVLIHCAAALFAYWFFIDLGCSRAASALGGLFFATAGFCGNTEWPQQLAPGIWSPLVFLFLLRVVRGRAVWRSAAWGGVFLGAAWLSGHHAPALAITLAAFGTAVAALVASRARRALVPPLALMFAVAVLVAAVQVFPAVEYGKLAKRWTTTGALTWKDKVEIPEHEDSGLHPADLPRLVLPGPGLRTDPFVGVIALSLAAIAVWSGFRRYEVRLFTVLGVCALLYALSRANPLYGLFYALVPVVEKSRAPIVTLLVFQFALAALAAIGADLLMRAPAAARESRVIRALLWFAGILFLAVLARIPGFDPRTPEIALLALLTAAVYIAFGRGHLRPTWTLALLGLLLILEQGLEVGYGWAQIHDPNRTLLKPLADTRDIADYLNWMPAPRRVDVNDNEPDLKFTFGDWFRLDTVHAFTASMPVATSEVGWWQPRMVRMYGIQYMVSRKPTRDGQHEVFTGKTGLKVFANSDVLARAWTVHQLLSAPDDEKGFELVRDGAFDPATAAVMVGSGPALDTCGTPDQVGKIEERPASVTIEADMGCKGLLVVSDNWYPGWRAQIDGASAEIWRVNTVIRGVVVPAGHHRVTMQYRPFSVYFGFLCTLIGLAAACTLEWRGRRGRAIRAVAQ